MHQVESGGGGETLRKLHASNFITMIISGIAVATGGQGRQSAHLTEEKKNAKN